MSEYTAPSAAAPSRARVRLMAVAFVLVTLAMGLIVSELAARAILRAHFGRFGYDLSVQSRGSMAESRYQVWAEPPNYNAWSGVSHTDKNGFRTTETITVAKPAGVRRIFILGGSMAYGSGPTGEWQPFTGQRALSDTQTVASSMEKILKEKHPEQRFQVINAATNWSKVHQQMIRYMRQVKDYSPDLVVSIDGQNDAANHREGSLNTWELTERSYEEQILATPQYRLRPVLGASHFLYLMAMLVFRPREQPAEESVIGKYEHVERPSDYEARLDAARRKWGGSLERQVTEYVTTMRYFHEALEVDQVPHLFILQPLIHLDGTKPFTRSERAIRGFIFSHMDEYLWRDEFYRLVEAEAPRLREQFRLPFEPLTHPFEAFSEAAYTDYCHLTPAGNEVFARRLVELAETRYPALFR